MSITEVLSCRLDTRLGSHSRKKGFLQLMSAPTQWLYSVPSCQSFWLKKRNENDPLANTVGLCFSNSSPGEQTDFLLDLCHLCTCHVCASTRLLGCVRAHVCWSVHEHICVYMWRPVVAIGNLLLVFSTLLFIC